MNAPRDAFTPSDVHAIPPSVPVRHWHSALIIGFGSATLIFIGVAFLLWRPLPLLGDPPDGSITSHLLAWGKMMLYALSGGSLCRSDVHAYWSRIADLSALAPGTAWHVGSRFGLCVGSALLSGGLLLRGALRPRTAEQHLAGARLHVGAEAVTVARCEAARYRGKQPGFMKLHPALDLPPSRWSRHLLIVGSVGSGKSQIILPLIEQIIAANHKAIIFDSKGEVTTAFPEPLLISPWDARSAIWSIGDDIATRDDAAVFAATFIPETPKNPFFATAAQMLLTGIVWSLQSEHGRSWGWRELSEFLMVPPAELHARLLPTYPEAAHFLDPAVRSAGDVYATLIGGTRIIRQLADAWGDPTHPDGTPRRRLSLRAWARDDYRSRKRQLILQAGPNAQLTSAYVGAMLNVLVSRIVSPELRDDPERSLFFVLDELSSLGKVNIAPLIDRGRSKGVMAILGLQDIAQLRAVYGPELAQAIPSMVATHVICQISPGETRDALAAMIGKRRVAVFETTTTTTGGSARIVEHHDRPILLPSDLTEGLGPQQGRRYPHGFAIRALVMQGGDVLRLDFPGTVWPKRRQAFVPASWMAVVERTPHEPAAAAASSPPPDQDTASTRSDLLRLADQLDAVRTRPPEAPDVERSAP
jgi:hypothetical protein